MFKNKSNNKGDKNMEKTKEIKNKKITVKNSTILIIAIMLMSIIFIANSFNKVNAEQPYRLSEAEMREMFNSKFLGHTGNVSTATVKALANVIIANNATNPEHQVKFNGIADNKLIIDSIKEYNDYNKIYDVKVKYNNNSQYITDIIVSEYDFADVYYDLNNISNSITSNSKDIYNLKTIIYIISGVNIVLLFTILILVIKSNKKIKKINIK